MSFRNIVIYQILKIIINKFIINPLWNYNMIKHYYKKKFKIKESKKWFLKKCVIQVVLAVFLKITQNTLNCNKL